MRALMRPARSKSSSAAACCISSASSSTNSRCWPDKNRSTRFTLAAYCSGVTRPQHAPGPNPTCASKHGRTSVVMQASGSFSNFRFSERQSAQLEAQIGTTRRAMSTMRRAARLSVYGPKYRVSARCFSRVYLIAGNTSPFVSAMNGYDLSSLKSALNQGAYWLMRFFSSTSDSCSLPTTMYSNELI